MATLAELGQAYQTYLKRPVAQPDIEAIGGAQGPWTKQTPAQLAEWITKAPEYYTANPLAPIQAESPTEYARLQGLQQQALLERQKKEEEGAFGAYERAAKAQEPLTAVYGRLEREAGIPEIQKTIGGYKGEIQKVQEMLDRLEGNISARTQGTFTSEAQRARQLAYEGGELRTQLGRLGAGVAPFTEQLSSAQQKIATQLGLVSGEQQKALQPLIMRIDAQSSRFAREITGYQQSKQNELSALLDKIERQRQLDDREWQRAQELAAEERTWARTKEQMALEYSYSVKKAQATSRGTAAETAPTTADIENSLRNEMAQYIAQGGNMDPNSGGANFFRALNAKYGGYGISSGRIRQIASDVYSRY